MNITLSKKSVKSIVSAVKRISKLDRLNLFSRENDLSADI